MRAADEGILGSWASITADLIKFFMSKDLNVYTQLAGVLDSMVGEEDEPIDPIRTPLIPVIAALVTVSTQTYAFLSEIPQIELDFTTSLVMGERIFEIIGRYTLLETPSRPRPIVLPDLRTFYDYAAAPCKHECAVLT
jgi:hypothetical protein